MHLDLIGKYDLPPLVTIVTPVALEHRSVLLEIKGGPFNPESPKFPALWAPEEGSELSSDYLPSLKKSCGLEIHD